MLTLLRQYRRRAALSQREAANLSGFTRVTWCQWEAGSRRPTPASIRQLAPVLKLTPDEVDALVLAASHLPASGTKPPPTPEEIAAAEAEAQRRREWLARGAS